MWIPRKAEAVIRQFAKQFPVVFVTGARQVGKTSTLAHLYPEYAYVTLDDPAKATGRIVVSAAPAATTQ